MGVHDAVQKGRCQRDLCRNTEIQPPRQRQRHDEHDDSCHHIWNRHVSLKDNLVDAFAPLNRFIPFKGDGGTLKDGHERVGYAGRDDNKADQVDAGDKGFVTCREDPDVE